MPVVDISEDAQLKTEVENAGDKIIVVDFFATWCGPCVQVAPQFAALSNKYADSALFLKVDVDKCKATAQAFQIEAMPTFVILKGGQGQVQMLQKIRGADIGRVEATIVAALAGAGAAANENASDCPVDGQVWLDVALDEKNCTCMNEKDDHSIKNVFDGAKDTFLESDCDEQLLISIGFKQPVKIHSICFHSAVSKDAAPDGSAPKTVKLFVNHPGTLDFDDVEGTPDLQTLTLTPEDVSEGKPVELRFVKFQNVTKLTMYIVDNQDDSETTTLSNLRLIGTPRDQTDMKEFKRVSGEKGERE